MNLEEAISQLIELGEKDPLTIARKIQTQQGTDWLTEQLVAYAEDLVAEIARRRLGSMRRSAEVALIPGETIARADLRLRSVWISSDVGWKRAADVTADEWDMKASYYEMLVGAIQRRADWCREVAALMRAEGAKTLGKLQAPLPSLPDVPELTA